jgi:hypothetical protein
MANDPTPNDTSNAPYKMAHDARNNANRIVVEGVDEPKSFAAHVPKDYSSPDVEDRRHSLPETALGFAQHVLNPIGGKKK